MDKNKQLIALVVLAGISLSVWLPNFKPAGRKLPGKTVAKNASAAPDKSTVAALLNTWSSVKGPAASPMAWGERNPFDAGVLDEQKTDLKNDVVEEREPAAYDLNGIFWNETKPSAIINDSVVGVGSVIEAATVKEISAAKVVLNDGTKDIVLRPQAAP
jgi:hypothetical protein